MTIKVVTEFLQNATIRIIAYITDDDGDLVDPTEVTIDLWDADGTKLQDGTAMSSTGATGIFEHYEYTDDDSPTGHWRGVVWVIDGTGATAYKSEGSFGFRLKV